MLWCHS